MSSSQLSIIAACICLLCLSCHLEARREVVDNDLSYSSGFCECPSNCSCNSAAQTIDCSAKNLTEVPIELAVCEWTDIETLNISHNLISILRPDSFFGLPDLKKLYLNSNRIERILNESFNGLLSLESLELSSNQITSLHGTIFHSLSTLINLYAYTNTISVIKEDDLVGLTSLKLLSLDDNRIAQIHPDAFQHTKKLQNLLLYNNELSSLPNGMLKGLTDLVSLAIYSNKITNIDNTLIADIPNLNRLYIQNNEITNISDGTFRSLTKVKLIYMSGNHLTELTSNTFIGLSSLETLVLSNNQISKIADDAFAHSANMKYLYMDNNRLESISRYMFSGVRRLVVLSLGNNLINSIADNAFSDQVFLSGLYLSSNRISHVSNSTFNGLYSMTALVLTSNLIPELPANMFRNSKFLVNFWIQSNKIKCISETAFQSLFYLELLDLSSNEISYLPNDVFQHTPRLKYLLLPSNKLTTITTRPFRNLPYLIQMALYFNKITYIEEGAFEGTENMLFLQWNLYPNFDYDNSLQCDCHASWFQKFLTQHRPYYSTVLCGGPLQLRGQSIFNVQQNCSDKMTVEIEPSTPSMFIGEGECVRLKCKSNSKSANLTWSRMEGDMRSSPHEECGDIMVNECGYVEDTRGFLTLSHFTEQDQGTYVCTSKLDDQVGQAQIRFSLGERPKILQAPSNKLYQFPPSFTVFDFKVEGKPEPVIEWYHNDEKIIMSERFHVNQTGSLIILDLDESNRGTYKAVATNGAGRVEASATLDIYYSSPCGFGDGCQNNGTCVLAHYCYCPEGYEGDTCESETSEYQYQYDYNNEHNSTEEEYDDYEYENEEEQNEEEQFDDDYQQNRKRRAAIRNIKKHSKRNRLNSIMKPSLLHESSNESVNDDLKSMDMNSDSPLPLPTQQDDMVNGVFNMVNDKGRSPEIDEDELKTPLKK